MGSRAARERSPRRARCPLLVASLLLAGCGSSGTRVPYGDAVALEAREGFLLTPLDYLEAGHERVLRRLQGSKDGRRLEHALAAGEGACVRVHAYVAAEDHRTTGALGSGVLLGGGRYVLTAAHNVPAASPTVRVQVTLADGRSFPARPSSAGSGPDAGGESAAGDWVLLELERDLEEPQHTPGVTNPRVGELCVLLGYPGVSAGRGSEGRFVMGWSYVDAPLAPVAIIAEMRGVDPLRIAPVSGVLPESGMSGGPILDMRGDLVALLSGVQMVHEGSATFLDLEVVPASSFRAACEEALARGSE